MGTAGFAGSAGLAGLAGSAGLAGLAGSAGSAGSTGSSQDPWTRIFMPTVIMIIKIPTGNIPENEISSKAKPKNIVSV